MLGAFAGQESKGFITRWTVAGDAAARTVTLPLTNAGTSAFDCTIDWGDGSALSTVTAYDDADRVHTYASNGTYNVEIKGTCEGWSFNNGGDKLKIIAVVNWGDVGSHGGWKYLKGAFYGCSNLASTGVGSILASGTGCANFDDFARACTSLQSIQWGLFRLHTTFTTFNATFFQSGITSLQADFLRYNTALSVVASAFRATPLASVGADFLLYNVNLTGASACAYLFLDCTKLQLRSDMFIGSSGLATRFLNKASNFTSCFERSSFSGTQGTAPALWDCDYGETITLDVAPAVDWVGGDIITGQTSGATAVVVAKVSTFVYKIKQHFTNGAANFALNEIVGVTGVADKLADQGATKPTFAGTPVSTGCFGGAGNSITSLSNYADIPANWK